MFSRWLIFLMECLCESSISILYCCSDIFSCCVVLDVFSESIGMVVLVVCGIRVGYDWLLVSISCSVVSKIFGDCDLV